MLVFRRKSGESVLIDGRIEVQVLEISGSRVKLGFVAPQAISVMRKELYLTQQENRRAASFSATGDLTRLVTAIRSQSGDGWKSPAGDGG